MCIQCPHKKPMMTVPINPTAHPELTNARGPANSPEPKDDFIKFAVARMSLKKEKKY